jgi:hypothetical protein
LAERELTTVVGDALVSLIEWTWPRLRPSARQIFGRVAEAARPDPPLHLCSSDGQESLTGLAVMNRGHVLGFVGWRHRVTGSFRSEPRRCVGDEVLWRDEVDSYRR